jgi:hypothetical protein
VPFVTRAQTCRDKGFDAVADELGGLIAEELAQLIVNHEDAPSFVDDGDAIGCGLEEGSEVEEYDA